MDNLYTKLEAIHIRFEEVGKLLVDPDIIADMDRYIKLNKEYKDLEEVNEYFTAYHNLLGNIKNARQIIAEEAARCGQFYVNNRWLGGTLTNYRTIKASVDRLIRMEYERDQGRLESRKKKERLDHARKIAKMERSLGGIKTMKGMPGVLFVIDPKREHNAIKEAKKLNIPIVALCDTNCDPTGIDYVIPANDDAIKSIRLFTRVIADAVEVGASLALSNNKKSEEAPLEDVEVITR